MLSENGVIPPQRLEEFQRMAGFRNLLVHRYEQVDDEVVYGVFRKRLGPYEEFARYVGEWMRTRGG